MMKYYIYIFTILLIAPFMAYANDKITITTRPLEPLFAEGIAEIISNQALEANDSNFGGFSGVLYDEKTQKITAISDRGHWLQASIEWDNYIPKRLYQAQIEPIYNRNGIAYKDIWMDAEGLSFFGPNQTQLLMSFEQKHRLEIFSLKTPLAKRYMQTRYTTPRVLRQGKRNHGLEAVRQLKSGHILLGREYGYDDKSFIPLWLSRYRCQPKNCKKLSWRKTSLQAIDGLGLTDIMQLPDKSLITLERDFNFIEGFQIVMRHIPWPAFQKSLQKKASPLTGKIIFQASGHAGIDNMESLFVRDAGENYIFYLLSDDNFNFLQRTQLLVLSINKKKLRNTIEKF